MNILFIGDIVGRTGRTAVKKILPQLKQKYEVDFTIANGENLAGGVGMTYETYREMNEAGIDYFTSGNHIWKKADFIPNLDIDDINVIRPANYAKNVPGKGYVELKVTRLDSQKARLEDKKIVIINLLGLVFMPEYLNNPFLTIDDILKSYSLNPNSCILVDFHAEATSEKVCLGHYLDGRVSAVVGTHTHVPTADARILPKGSAYITDVGMAGSLNSSIGDEVEPIIEHFKTGLPFKLEVAGPPAVVGAVLIKINDQTGLADEIVQIREIVD